MNSPSTSNELHVIFGTGPLGLSVMRALVKRGQRVRMINRGGSAAVPSGVEVVAGDAYDSDTVRQLTEGAAAVYQCAQPGYTEWAEKFPPLQASILNGVSANGAKFIVAENLYMYGLVDRPMTEDLPHAAHTRKGQVRADMSQTLMQAHANGTARVAIARGSDFYGPYVLGSTLGERVFIPMLQGKPANLVGNVDMPHSYTYIDDFGEALALLGERDEALGEVWHVPNAPAISHREIVTLIAAELGVEPRLATANKLMVQLFGLINPYAREMVEMMYEFTEPFVVDHSKFVRVFGDISTPLADGLRETIAWYRDYLAVNAAA